MRIAIAVPLEEELVAKIREQFPEHTVDYRPELLPPRRFPADHAGDPAFSRSDDAEKEYWDMLLDADILYGFPNESPEGLARIVRESRKLRWIQAMAAGAGGALKASGLTPEDLGDIIITSSAGVHARPLAEFAVMGVLEGFKDVAGLREQQAKKEWPTVRQPVRLLDGSTVVITGLGEIGMETAHLLGTLGAKIYGTKRSPSDITGVEKVVTNAELGDLLPAADAVVNTLPGTPETEKLFDSAVFAAMKPGTVFVNVGRGTVVDEDALLAALNDGTVSYACLDVFAVEPLPADSPLWEHPRVLVSPHTSALSEAEARLISERFVANLRALERGETLPHTVDPVRFY